MDKLCQKVKEEGEWGVVGAWCSNPYLSLKQPFFLTLMLFLYAWVGITRPPTMLVPPFASQAEGKRKRHKTQLRWILCSSWNIWYFLFVHLFHNFFSNNDSTSHINAGMASFLFLNLAFFFPPPSSLHPIWASRWPTCDFFIFYFFFFHFFFNSFKSHYSSFKGHLAVF